MDELRRAADLLVADPPASAPSLDDLAHRNTRRRNRRRAAVGALALVLLVAGSLVAITRRPSTESHVITRPVASSGRLAIATDHGVTLIDEHKGVIADVDLGFAPATLLWSPNGRWLVVSNVDQGAFVRRDGEMYRRLPSNVGDLQWIGAETLFYSGSDGRYEKRPLGAPRRTNGASGMLSPDGTTLVSTNAADRSVVVSGRDGSNGKRFAPVPEVEAGLIPLGFSPDGRWFLYDAYPAGSASIAMDGVPRYAIRVADGTTIRLGLGLVYDGWLDWSPDGRTLLVVDGVGRFLTDRKVLRSCDLTAVRCIDVPSPADVSTFDPAWSPDGSRLAFVRVSTHASASGPLGELWTSDVEGDDARPVSGVAPGVLRPMWTADGAAVLVLNRVGGGGATAIERVPIAGGTPRRLAAVDASHAQGFVGHVTPVMAWSPSTR